MAVTLEYISAVVLELAGNAARDGSTDTIGHSRLLRAILNDEELNRLFPGGGTGAGITTGAASRLRELCGAGAVPAAEAVGAGAAPGGADTDGADTDGAAQVTAAVAQAAVAAGGADSSSGSDSDGDGDDDSKGTGSGETGALASKPYSELQAMAKARGISANTKKELMVEALTTVAVTKKKPATKKTAPKKTAPKKKTTTKK
jgi:hypothetical protein